MTPAPFFSIIMPVYNGEAYLRKALDSLVQQTLSPTFFEVIALNDASTDSSAAILQEYTERLPLVILDGARKGNWVASTNLGLRHARGEFLSFLHQDDLYDPTRLETCRAFLLQNLSLRVLTHPAFYASSTGETIGLWAPPFSPGLLSPQETLPLLLLQNNLAVPGVVFHRNCLAQCGFLDESLRYTADWEFWLRILCAFPCLYLKTPLSSFRIHGQSQTVSFASKQTEYGENLQIVIDRFTPSLASFLSPRRTSKLHAMATFGMEMNLLLAALGTHARPVPWKRFFRALFRLSPLSFFQYLSRSQVVPRVTARLRANLHSAPE